MGVSGHKKTEEGVWKITSLPFSELKIGTNYCEIIKQFNTHGGNFMHVCCIGKFSIPAFTCKNNFPFNSNKRKTEEKKEKRLSPHANAAESKTTQPSGNIQRKDVSLIVCVCVGFTSLC